MTTDASDSQFLGIFGNVDQNITISKVVRETENRLQGHL